MADATVLLRPIADSARIRLNDGHRLPISIIGAGAIVDTAHLPAYRSLGLEVRSIFDLNRERAEDVAARHGVGHVASSVAEVLSDPDISVVDIAVVPWAQPDLIEEALMAGKHLLCQKPLALDATTAGRLAALAEASGRICAVNQQLRYDEGIAVAAAMLRAGWVGEPTTVSFEVNIQTDWSAWDWLVSSPRLDFFFHSIHYLDAIRALLGDPLRVFATAARRPGQQAAGETRTISTLIFGGDVRAIVHVNHENVAGDVSARFRIDGTEGSIRGTLGMLDDYPYGRPDSLDVFSTRLPTDGWLAYPVSNRWIPHAFAGPMASLLTAIATDSVPATGISDNVHTIELVEALYRSVETGEAQSLPAERTSRD